VRVVFRFRLELTRTKERAKRRVRTVGGPAFCIAARMHFRPQQQFPAKADKKHKPGEPISFSEENHFAICKIRKLLFFQKELQQFLQPITPAPSNSTPALLAVKIAVFCLGKDKNCKNAIGYCPRSFKCACPPLTSKTSGSCDLGGDTCCRAISAD